MPCILRIVTTEDGADAELPAWIASECSALRQVAADLRLEEACAQPLDGRLATELEALGSLR